MNHKHDAVYMGKTPTFSLLTEAEVVLLEAEEHELEPEPGKKQHDHHVWKSKGEPAGEVDHTTIVRKETSQKRNKRCQMLPMQNNI